MFKYNTMNPKLLLPILFALALLWGVSGACVIPVSNMTVTSTANNTLCTGTYELVDGIIITPSGVNFNCNNSNLIGVGIGNGIYSINDAYLNITNCNLNNFSKLMLFEGATQTDVNILNNVFGNATTTQLEWKGYNSKILGNTFLNSSSTNRFYTVVGYNTNITNNTFYGKNVLSESTSLLYNYSFVDNNFYGLLNQGSITSYSAFNFNYLENSTFDNNLFDGYQKSFLLRDNVQFITFTNNDFQNSDEAVYLSNVNNITFTNNRFDNITKHYDAYDISFEINTSTGIKILNNEFTEVGTGVLYGRLLSNSLIANNTVDLIPLSSYSIYLWSDYNEPRFAWGLLNDYKSYNTDCDGTNKMNDSCYKNYKSENVTIIDNTYDADTQVYIIDQNSSNLVQDLENVYNKSFNANYNFSSYRTYFINDAYTQLSHINYARQLSTDFCSGYSCITSPLGVNWTINNMAVTFQNLNVSLNYTFTMLCPSDIQNYDIVFGQTWRLDQCIAGGSFPVSNMTVTATENNSLHKGTYYLNSEDALGVFNLNGNDNLVFDCSGATINGNTTGYGLYTGTGQSVNFTIQNCHLNNYRYGIYTRNDINGTIKNSIISNTSSRGITITGAASYGLLFDNISIVDNVYGLYLERMQNSIINNSRFLKNSNTAMYILTQSQNSTISNNYIYENESASGTGIYLGLDDFNFVIENNIVDGYTNGIRIVEGINTTIRNNRVYNQLLWGIATHTINTTIINNIVQNSSWNLIYANGTDHYIAYNELDSWQHNGFDIHNDDRYAWAYNIIFEYNNITNTYNDTFAGALSAISIKEGENITVRYNYIYNVKNITLPTTSSGMGINIEDENTSVYVYSNTLDDISGYALRCTARECYFENNTLSNIDNLGIAFRLSYMPDSQPLNTRYVNNIVDTGINDYYFASDTILALINETSTDYHKIILPNGAVKKYIGDFRKELLIQNNTITTYTTPTYNSYCNSTNVVCQLNASTHTEFLSASTFSLLLKLDSMTQPRIMNKSLTVTDLNWSYILTTQLDVNYTGTGTINITGMHYINEVEYLIYYNGAYSGTGTADNISITTSGNWIFSTSALPDSEDTPTSLTVWNEGACWQGVTTFSGTFKYMSMIVLAVILAVIIMVLLFSTGTNTGMTNQEAGNSMISIVIFFGIALVVGMILLNMLINIVFNAC